MARPILDIEHGQQQMYAAVPFAAVGFLALLYVVVLRARLLRKETGVHLDPPCPKLDYLASKVKTGSIAFLKEEYKYLSLYVVFWAVVLVLMFSFFPIATTADGKAKDSTDGIRTMSCFLAGAFLSGLSGYIGMSVATEGNVRTTTACAKGTLNDGLGVAFSAGAAMGFGVVGLASFGLSVMLMAMTPNRTPRESVQYLHSFGFGASSIALFARVAGGIYTKAADVGADLVGKIEAGIDEDDPHNPAVIADNVGDNVGDVAGMGADLFESYVGSIVGAATLGAGRQGNFLVYPVWLMAAGLLASFVGCMFVSTNEQGGGQNCNLSKLMWALDKGMLIANLIFVLAAAAITYVCFGADNLEGWKLYSCVIIGMVTGMAIGKGTEYFTSFDYGPTVSIKDRARTGPATVVIQGMGVGMISTVLPTFFLAVAILGCAQLGQEYGVACAAVGMLGTLAISLSTDAYGPVADNAGGLAEMAHLGPEVRGKTDALDALGNTTAAIGKGFAVGSAVLTALSLLAAFKEEVCNDPYAVCYGANKLKYHSIIPVNNLGSMDIYHSADRSAGSALYDLTAVPVPTGPFLSLAPLGGAPSHILEGVPMLFEVSEPILLAGVIIGAMLPYLFCALTMLSVGKAAAEMIDEVRRQFREVKNARGRTLMEAIRESIEKGHIADPDDDVEPDSDRCVLISTRSSIKEMIAPGIYAVLTPLVVGFGLGPRALMGVLAGCIGSATMLGVMMSNAGGAWDNSKKLCEKLKIKKTEQGKACIVGDTVGDPFKDTSGPSLNILLKLMSMIALLIAPLIRAQQDWHNAWIGAIPLALMILATLILVKKNILSWADPLKEAQMVGETIEDATTTEAAKIEAARSDDPKADVKTDVQAVPPPGNTALFDPAQEVGKATI
jgi:H(+)-translocating pyrophosphatase